MNNWGDCMTIRCVFIVITPQSCAYQFQNTACSQVSRKTVTNMIVLKTGKTVKDTQISLILMIIHVYILIYYMHMYLNSKKENLDGWPIHSCNTKSKFLRWQHINRMFSYSLGVTTNRLNLSIIPHKYCPFGFRS